MIESLNELLPPTGEEAAVKSVLFKHAWPSRGVENVVERLPSTASASRFAVTRRNAAFENITN
jgi:hypothetical protein